ncbi:transmembrane protease serine 9-like [Macrobrachium nipponense]|uniref:transmembrane protease serine 9-like n=1 Tax=Macrobrachium nipponense TaxID=159736 RepID=UPI0030C7DCF4
MSSSNRTRSVMRFLLICIALWRSTCQDIAPRCSTTAVPAGLCVPVRDCPSLLDVSEVLSINDFLRQYGGCGRGSNGDVLLCCSRPRVEAAISPVPANVPPANVFPDAAIVSKPANDLSCGRRVVGRGPEWPFLAAVGRTLRGEFNMHCQGAYISDRWVLVEGLCVYEHPVFEVIPGSIWTQGQQSRKNRIMRTLVSEVTDDGQFSKGVALLELEKPVIFDNYVQSICLPDERSTETPSLLTALVLHENIHSSALARREVLLKSVRGIPGTSKTCDSSVDVPSSYKARNPVDICATNHEFCNNRIGPMLVEEDANSERYRLIGVGGTTRDSCFIKIHVFSSVVSHLRWIRSQISSSGSLAQPLSLVDTRFLDEGQQCGQRAIGEGPEFPFMVAIGKEENNNFEITCGGVIISNLWVLTEAACVVDNFITYIKIAVNTDQERAREVVLRKRHDSFDPVTRKFNVALLKLKEPLIFNDYVQPACLPSSEDVGQQTMFAANISPTTVSGVTSLQQRFTLVHRVSRGPCEASGYLSHPFNSDTICASKSEACNYSTRLMLLQKEPTSSNLVVQGIGGTSDYPCFDLVQGYTQVFPHRQWILDHIQGQA